MSYAENAKLIGQIATIVLGGLTVEVEVLDYKNSYGKDRWLVKPVAGAGQVWVEKISTKKK
jgi:hypothetical protein